MVTYCQSTEVSELLQIETFSSSTSPTFSQVEKIITRKEDRINQKLRHSWKEATTSDLFLDVTFLDPNNGARFDLPNYTIRDITKLNVWDGSAYVNFLTTRTEGRNSDYWIDKKLGVLYVKSDVRRVTNKPIELSYTYGETVVSGDVEDLCIYLTAVDILSMYSKAISFPDDGNSQTSSQDQRIIHMKGEINKIYNSLSYIGTF